MLSGLDLGFRKVETMDAMTLEESAVIERCLDSGRYYLLDYIPFHPEEATFLPLEESWENTILRGYSHNVALVLLNSIYEHFPKLDVKTVSDSHTVLVTNGRDVPDPSMLYEMVTSTVINLEYDQVIQVLSVKNDAMMQVKPGLEITFFGFSTEAMDSIKQLATGRGLFVKLYDDGFQEVV